MSFSQPVLLLKTQSGPKDAYLELFSKPHSSSSSTDAAHHFSPSFVPVLRHHFRDAELSRVRALLQKRRISAAPDAAFGGMIFTSQRAVEAFASLVEEGKDGDDPQWPHLDQVPFYSVGPATTRALTSIPATTSPQSSLTVHGSHTGTGDVLAPFILSHYSNEIYPSRRPPPSLLFLVGETRRDIIPKTLMNPALSPSERIEVVEEVVYGTGVMESFPDDFSGHLERTKGCERRWVVVFSPTGCDGMLRGMGLLNEETGKVDLRRRDGRTVVVTIGPTTQKHLREEYGFDADAMARQPSPEGVLEAMLEYESRQGS
ncbi:uroporphyrinogen-III synthase hemD domain-containing protein [Sarocladium implicatum]|nr:uroporphyrinogen-III synthase hemD domain-containing protein [Sarocladium implicatum]